jgi:hypothetical protein
VIVTDLTNQVAAVGTNVALEVDVTGTGPFTYQWLCEGTNLPTATANPFVLSNVVPQQSGSYQVVVSNIAGTATSSIAILSILSPPQIVANPVNQTAAVGADVTILADVTGSGPLGYQWLFNGSPLSGATSNPLILSNVAPSAAGNYQLLVTNPVGSATSSTATLSVLSAPVIVTDLTNQSALVGANISFQIGASGTGPLNYQWLFNGAALAGSTSSVLNLANVAPAQAGSYQVIVSNAVGTATSALATLNVIGPPSLSISSLGGNSFQLTFSGPPFQSYQVQYSTGIADTWQSLATVTADTSGLVNYIVSGAAPSQFFRVVSQ